MKTHFAKVAFGLAIVFCLSSVLLARETKDLLIGEAAHPHVRESLLRIAGDDPDVRCANGVLTVQMGQRVCNAAWYWPMALRGRRWRKRLEGANTRGAHNQDLARFHVANVGCANQIERAGFGADDPGLAELSDRERTESVRVTDPDHAILGHHHEGERPANLRDCVDNRRLDTLLARTREQMDNDLGVAVGLEDGTAADQRVAQLAGVHQVAVVRDGDLAVGAVDQDRLRVEELALARR